MNWIASLLILTGYLAVVLGRREGFLVQAAGCLLFIWLYAGTDNALVLTNIVFAAVNAYGYRRWGLKPNPIPKP